MTGVESILGPAIGKVAGAAAARSGGFVYKQRMKRRKQEEIEIILNLQPSAAIEYNDPAIAQKIIAFCNAPEFEHFAASLTQAYLVERGDRKSADLLEKIENEFCYSLARWFDAEPPSGLAHVVFAALVEAVLAVSSRLTPGTTDLSPALQAQLIKTTASLSAASTQNTSLLSSLARLDPIFKFQESYSMQVSALHATMRLPHTGTTRQVPYEELFVAPSLWPANRTDSDDAVSLSEAIQYATRVVLVGDPGGGKSTQVHKLTYDVATAQIPSLKGLVPFFVVLKDYAPAVRNESRRTLADYIEGLCRSPYQMEPPEQSIEYLLLNNRAIVIFDGLDELIDISLRRDVVQAVEGFANRYPTCPIVVTSRRVGYDEVPLNEYLFTKMELGKFDVNQVQEYVKKWFALDESIKPATREQLSNAFMVDSQFVSDLRSNPLLLSLMCGIYASENYIPRNRPDVYEKCAMLLFERWDKQRGISATLPFDAHVQSAMRSLALYIYTNHSEEEGISRTRLVAYMRDYLRERRFETDEQAENAAIEFIDFCKGRAWVLTDVGAELYGFTHRTFLEYFSASQLVRLNPNPKALLDQLLPHLKDESWDVVAQLALQILSRTVEDGADDFLELVLDEASIGSERPDTNLISFACRCLEFIVPRPAVLTSIVNASVQLALDCSARGRSIKREEQTFYSLLSSASDENRGRVADVARARLNEALAQNSHNEAALLLALQSPLRTLPRQRLAAQRDWTRWVGENRRIFSREIVLQRTQYAWVAIAEYEWGQITLLEALSLLGVRFLYDYKQCGITHSPPIAYRYISECFGRHSEFLSPFIDPFLEARPRLEDVAREAVLVLPSVKGSWLRYRKDYEAVAKIVEPTEFPAVTTEDTLLGAAVILLALPLVEIVIGIADQQPWASPPASLADALAAARINQVVSSDLQRSLERIFGDLPAAKELVLSWINGSRRLVSHIPRRSSGEDRTSVR